MRGREQNIFERLSRYKPSEDREPREDFTTEALAFLLSSSNGFCERFVVELLGAPHCRGRMFEVETQTMVEAPGAIKPRRVDMIIRSIEDNGGGEKIGIEVKIDPATGFQTGQIRDMGILFPDRSCVLGPRSVLKEKEGDLLEHNVRGVSWEEVFCLLSATASTESETNRTLMAQFCEYLEARGLAEVVLTQYPMKVKSIADAAKLMDEWTQTLEKLKDELGLSKNGEWKHPRWDYAKSGGSSYYGVYGSGDAYAGFEVTSGGSVWCYFQDYRPGKLGRTTERGAGPKLSESNGMIQCIDRKPLPDSIEYRAVAQVFHELKAAVNRQLDAVTKQR